DVIMGDEQGAGPRTDGDHRRVFDEGVAGPQRGFEARRHLERWETLLGRWAGLGRVAGGKKRGQERQRYGAGDCQAPASAKRKRRQGADHLNLLSICSATKRMPVSFQWLPS